MEEMRTQSVRVPCGATSLDGDLSIPEPATGLVLFAHGSGSSRHSPRNRAVAKALNAAGLGTLLVDLLTSAEEQMDARTGHLRFNIGLLAGRLSCCMDFLHSEPQTGRLSLGLFGASTGAAAALVAAADRPENVAAVVSRGGRPDLAGASLEQVQAPTLLIVGGADSAVIEMNREAAARLHAPHEIEIVPGASHLFEEPGALEQVAALARRWFVGHLV
jgi:dienelactone hydrolase